MREAPLIPNLVQCEPVSDPAKEVQIMKVVILAALVSVAAFSASAQTVTCKAQADEKKLAGRL